MALRKLLPKWQLAQLQIELSRARAVARLPVESWVFSGPGLAIASLQPLAMSSNCGLGPSMTATDWAMRVSSLLKKMLAANSPPELELTFLPHARAQQE